MVVIQRALCQQDFGRAASSNHAKQKKRRKRKTIKVTTTARNRATSIQSRLLKEWHCVSRKRLHLLHDTESMNRFNSDNLYFSIFNHLCFHTLVSRQIDNSGNRNKHCHNGGCVENAMFTKFCLSERFSHRHHSIFRHAQTAVCSSKCTQQLVCVSKTKHKKNKQSKPRNVSPAQSLRPHFQRLCGSLLRRRTAALWSLPPRRLQSERETSSDRQEQACETATHPNRECT
jgi:hypothetical protein